MDIKTPIKNETLIVALGTALCYRERMLMKRILFIFWNTYRVDNCYPASIIYTVFLFAAFLMTLYMASSFQY
jgi:hypothetical protein